jgi:hypothetical protein
MYVPYALCNINKHHLQLKQQQPNKKLKAALSCKTSKVGAAGVRGGQNVAKKRNRSTPKWEGFSSHASMVRPSRSLDQDEE